MTTPGIQTALVIDDDPAFNRILCRTLALHGIDCVGTHDGASALQEMRRHRPDAVILDLNLAGSSGLPLIAPLREVRPDTRIVVLTGYASITTAVERHQAWRAPVPRQTGRLGEHPARAHRLSQRACRGHPA
nr:response regulator [Denitromonas sp.]